MLILTKEEINEKIDCFRKLIGIYSTKIDFLQKLLQYYERNGKTVDCIVLNICVKGMVEEIFSVDDQIQIQSQNFNFNELFTHSASLPTQVIKSSFKSDLNKHEKITSNPIQRNEMLTNKNTGVSQKSNLAIKEDPVNTIQHMDAQKSLTNKSSEFEPTFPKMLDNNSDSLNINLPVKMKVVSLTDQNSDLKRSAIAKLKKQAINQEREQITRNIFLSNTSFEDLNHLHLALKNEELLNFQIQNSKSTKLKQFNCEFCSSTFSQKGVLNRHKILRHSPTVVKPHVCPNCQKGFTLKHHLKNHLKCKSGCRYFS